jgi:hypothetical protein
MQRSWSEPLPYDLSRTINRASVPRSSETKVPELPGTYVVFLTGEKKPEEAILDVGECGPRNRSKPCGLRARIASSVTHSASEKIASDIRGHRLTGDFRVIWRTAESKQDAKFVQDALITLFRREFSRQPRYNSRPENCARPELFEPDYIALKTLVISLEKGNGVRSKH